MIPRSAELQSMLAEQNYFGIYNWWKATIAFNKKYLQKGLLNQDLQKYLQKGLLNKYLQKGLHNQYLQKYLQKRFAQ